MEYTLYRKTKWLEFIIVDNKPKTLVIHVYNTKDQYLGLINWYGAWRQYIFQPHRNAQLFFNNGCLQDIADVLTSLNTEHKNNRRKREKQTQTQEEESEQ